MRPAWLVVLLLTTCSGPAAPRPPSPPTPPPPPVARAFQIIRGEDLIPGPAAGGQLGDFRLANEKVAFVISDAPFAFGFSETGGNLMDAAPVGGVDLLSQMYLYLDDTFPRQARNDSVEVLIEGGDEAAVRVRGHDSLDPTLAVETVYRLHAGEDVLRLSTTVTNTGQQRIEAYEIGDVISWGQSQHFAPGFGFVFKGRLETPWLAGVGESSSYGYTAVSGILSGPHGSSWSDTVIGTFDLAPGASATVERYLVVSDVGDAAAVYARMLALRGERAPRQARGTVREDGSGQPIPGARVTALDAGGRPLLVIATDAEGHFAAPLPEDAVRLEASAPGRVAIRDAGFAELTDAELTLSPLAQLNVEVVDEHGPGPAKLTFQGLAGTPDPVFGAPFRAAGAGPVVLSVDGRASIAIAPGRYRVYASRGPEYQLASAELHVQAGSRQSVKLSLERAFVTDGYVSADLHQHQLPSPDSSVSLPDRVVANLAEGVELAVATDHNEITDLGPSAQALGPVVTRRLRTVVGLEATTETIGHFMAYPLARDGKKSRGGAPLVDGRNATTIFGLLRALRREVVVQVNHPRSGKSGYFDAVGFPAGVDAPLPDGLDLTFDAVELLNGKRVTDFDRVLADWFVLLARGHIVTGTGGSDSHAVYGQECGYPRVYLGVGDDPLAVSDDAIVEVVRQRRDVIVSNGPWLTVRHAGRSAVGGHFALSGKETLTLDVEVHAAAWVDTRRLQIWKNGKLATTLPIEHRVAAGTSLRLATQVRLSAADVGHVVFVVRGDLPLEPVVPSTSGPVTPIAVANPVFVERR